MSEENKEPQTTEEIEEPDFSSKKKKRKAPTKAAAAEEKPAEKAAPAAAKAPAAKAPAAEAKKEAAPAAEKPAEKSATETKAGEKAENAPATIQVGSELSAMFGDYTYNELLDRIFKLLNKSEDGAGGRTKVPIPSLGRIGSRKTGFKNFKEVCQRLHRPPKHLMAYLQVECGSQVSLDGNQQLVIRGRFQQGQIQKVLTHYIREYVACKVCKSYDTSLEKENRLNFVKCSQCNSRLSVQPIQKGFQAQVGKRKLAQK